MHFACLVRVYVAQFPSARHSLGTVPPAGTSATRTYFVKKFT